MSQDIQPELSELALRLRPYILNIISNAFIETAANVSGGGSGGGTTGGSVPNPHALNSSYHSGTLADSQAPQFLMVDGTRPLTGNLSLNSGVTIDGMDPSVHIADPDAHHPRATATNGLAIHYDAQELYVDLAYGFVWTNEHQFNSGLLATHVGAVSSLVLDPTNDLTLHPGGNVYVQAGTTMRSTDWVSGFLGVGWGLTNVSGASLLDIRKIQVEELHAYAFIADIERVRVGETFVTQSMGLLHDDFVTPSIGSTVSIKVEDVPAIGTGAIFLDNEWVLIQLIDRSGGGLVIERMWGQVASYVPNGDGTQSYTYTHRHGTSGVTIKSGAYVLDFGASGDGYIHESVIDAAGSPYTRYATWVTDPSVPANRTVHVQVGNLDSITDTILSPTGYGLYGSNVYLKGSLVSANGNIVIDNVTGMSIQEDDYNTPDAKLHIDWWPDITVRSGTPSFTLYEGVDNSSGSFTYHQNFATIGAYPTAGVGVLLQIFAKGITGHTDAYFSMQGGGPGSGDSSIAIGADDVTFYATVTFGTANFAQIRSTGSGTNNIGSSSVPFDNIYVHNIIADSVTGGTALGGQIWQYDTGDMYIKSSSSSTRTLYIANPGSGVMNLDVDGSIVVAGNVDGVDVSGLNSSYGSHTVNADAHHARVHALASTSGLGSDHTVTGLTSGQVLKATSSTTAVFVQLSHAELGNLAGAADDHTQYVHISTGRTITAVHQFNPTATGAPFTLGTHAIGQLVSGLYADSVNKSVVAGNGMSGGGALTNNVTLTLGTPSTLTISTSNSVTSTSHTHAITSSSNPGAAAALLASTSSGGLTLQTLTLGGSSIIISSTAGTVSIADNVDATHKFGLVRIGKMGTLTAFAGFSHRLMADATNYGILHGSTGDLFLNTAANKIIYFRNQNNDVMLLNAARLYPTGSGLIALGDYNRKWSELNVVQLVADKLVASNVMATIGGRILVAPTAKLTRDILSSDTTIYLDTNSFVSPQVVYMASVKAGVPQAEYMRIMSGPTTISATEYSYTVVRNVADTGNLVTNPGFEVDLSGWSVMGTVADASRDATTYNYETASAKVIFNGTSAIGGILFTFTSVASRMYNVSFWAKTSAVTDLQYDVYANDGSLNVNGLSITGTVDWTHYNFTFTAVTSGTMFVRFFSDLTASGTFWIDEVIVEQKYGANGFAWNIGDANVNLGYKTGAGFIDLTSVSTILGHNGPTIAVYSRSLNGGQPKPTVAMGNLRSYVDYTFDNFGFALGNDLTLSPTSGLSGFTADRINGLRLFNTSLQTYTSGTLALCISPTNGIEIYNTGSMSSDRMISFKSVPYGVSAYNYLVGWIYNNTDATRTGIEIKSRPLGTTTQSASVTIAADGNVGKTSAIVITGGASQIHLLTNTSGLATSTYDGDQQTFFSNYIQFYFGTNALNARTLSNLITLTSGWAGTAGTNSSEISNDLVGYKQLMIVGNSKAGAERRVGLWDSVQIGGTGFYQTLNVNGGIYAAGLLGESWHTIGYGSEWASYGSGWGPASYKKFGDIVYMAGLVFRESGTGTLICTLPVGYRPTTNKLFATILSNGSTEVAARISIDTSGNVTCITTATTISYVSLDPVFFSTLV